MNHHSLADDNQGYADVLPLQAATTTIQLQNCIIDIVELVRLAKAAAESSQNGGYQFDDRSCGSTASPQSVSSYEKNVVVG